MMFKDRENSYVIVIVVMQVRRVKVRVYRLGRVQNYTQELQRSAHLTI